MFAAPPEQSLEWNEAGVEGMARFLRRFWREVVTHASQPDHPQVDAAALDAAQKTLRRQLHETIQKVGDDYGRRHSFNTAIAALMELLNHVAKFDDRSDQGRAVRHEALQAMVLLLNPVTPHVCHALWQVLGHPESLLEDVPFPQADPAALVRDTVTLAVQVNGKLRGTIECPPTAPREAVEAAALPSRTSPGSWKARPCARSSWCRGRSSTSSRPRRSGQVGGPALPVSAPSSRLPAMRPIPTSVRFACLAALVFLCSACGFHLRNALSIPQDLMPVRVVAPDPYSPLAESLADSMTRAGATPASSDALVPATTLTILPSAGATRRSASTNRVAPRNSACATR
jgi:hypothetical protein